MDEIVKLKEELSKPREVLIKDMARLDGDLLVLGAGGKMGPDLCILAKMAVDKVGQNNRVIAVSRFTEKGIQAKLNECGVETIRIDMLESNELASLPIVRNIIYMAGMKFGTTGNETLTWAMNSYLPGKVAEQYKESNIVVFSTGNVYPLVPVNSGGSTENDRPEPVGEYAQSCLGRERVFSYFSEKNKTPILIYRLNYAIDFKYGVLHEIARSVRNEKPVDLSMGYINMIWQGDANEYALRCLKLCTTPPEILNITGSGTLSVKWLAEEFGIRFGTKPVLINQEQTTALLSNAAKSHKILGDPQINIHRMIDIVTLWTTQGGELINKPTHFQERKGNF